MSKVKKLKKAVKMFEDVAWDAEWEQVLENRKNNPNRKNELATKQDINNVYKQEQKSRDTNFWQLWPPVTDDRRRTRAPWPDTLPPRHPVARAASPKRPVPMRRPPWPSRWCTNRRGSRRVWFPRPDPHPPAV